MKKIKDLVKVVEKPKFWQRLQKNHGGYWLRKCRGCGRTDFDSDEKHELLAGAWGGPHGETVHYVNIGSNKRGEEYCGLVDEQWIGRRNGNCFCHS